MRERRPVYPGYFADPFVWKHEGVYYAVGTGAAEAEGQADRRVFQMLRSTDLDTWTPLPPALAALHPDYGDAYWAPEVAFAEGKFWMYYSVGRGDKAHHIRVAVSESPEGPYEDTGARVTSPFDCPFSIDASPFQDDDGQWYLFYARDFLDTHRPGTVVVMDRLLDMKTLAGESRVVVRAQHAWQRFVSHRVMYGGVYDWHTIEGPCVRKHDGRYYCFFSAGRWENESYGVDYAVADQVMGPYTCDSNDDGARVLHTIPGKLIGPGHNSMTVSQDGGSTDYIVYHAWDAQMTARRMFLDPIVWTPQGPRCV
jgi:beta-xylosidase